jgi:hypothetical protein
MKEVTDKQELDFAALALFSKHPEMPGESCTVAISW